MFGYNRYGNRFIAKTLFNSCLKVFINERIQLSEEDAGLKQAGQAYIRRVPLFLEDNSNRKATRSQENNLYLTNGSSTKSIAGPAKLIEQPLKSCERVSNVEAILCGSY
jgi:hypothetical protein